ncbi:hypothetical protein [Accumulibacter sp.]|nr:hypothetical protein [Accumulibacter sp.]HRF03994.1 hypothetical protein [Accumulibacter sp.]
MHAFLRQSALMVPLNFVRGTPDRTIEHTLMGVPVLTSRLAVGGVDGESVTHFLVADSPREYSGVILRISNDPAERPAWRWSGG